MPTMEGFSKKEIKAARATCQLQDMLGHPSDTDFANMENFNFIKIVQSLYMSSTIPLTSSARGKTTRKHFEVVVVDYVEV